MTERYRVEPTGCGFWPFRVVAGDGTRELFIGHRNSCERVAAELTTAFRDGEFVGKGDYDALRAENGRLREGRDSFQREGIRAMEELEAARGLLRQMDDYLSRRGDGEAIHTGSKFHMEIDAFLTATPAPEVRRFDKPSLLKECNVTYSNSSRPMAEQGERQEAVARRRALLITSYCGDGDAHCTDESPCADCLSMCNVVTISGGKLEHVGQLDQLPGFNKLVLEDTSRDMFRLEKALEQIQRWDGFPATGKTWEGSGEPMSFSACYGSNGERDFMRNVAAEALAAHRQAQQGGSHDT